MLQLYRSFQVTYVVHENLSIAYVFGKLYELKERVTELSLVFLESFVKLILI